MVSFSLQNAVCFIILTYLVPVFFIFYIQDMLKLKKKIIPAPKGFNEHKMKVIVGIGLLIFLVFMVDHGAEGWISSLTEA